MKSILLTCLVYLTATCAIAQNGMPMLSDGDKAAAVDSISRILEMNYVFPDVGTKMGALIKSNLKSGAYNSITNPPEFAIRLSQDLRSVSQDKHLRVVYDPRVIAAEKQAKTAEDREKLEATYAEEMKRINYGFKEAKILDGNIGYLDLREFANPKYAAKTAHAAMKTFSKADALIIDLRNNGGGSPAMIQLITSYFYPAQPLVHLNSFYDRPNNETTETWTLPEIPGVRTPDIKLFILTSKETFSAAEEFSYNLKNLKRATLIGETTGGGAHPTGSFIATDKYFVRVPRGRAINPITKTNWEGTGVTPDIAVEADKAFAVAYAKARRR